jgi:hypothetical protein
MAVNATNARPVQAQADQATAPAQREVMRAAVRDIRIYQHSNLLYWWAVWVWGFICAGLSYFFGVGIAELATAEEKRIYFHPSSWLGLSFIGVLLFVVVFTNVKARGIYSFMLIMVAGGLVIAAQKMPGMDKALGWLPLLRVHMNVAFYVTFSLLLALVWLFVVVVIDHFTWFRFSPGQVAEEHLVGQAMGHVYNSEGMVVRRLPDDFFRHRILGLGLIGLGTGDLSVHPANGESFELHNIWRANKKQPRIERMIATRVIADK